MPYILSSDILTSLGFYSVEITPDKGQIFVWKNSSANRQIVVATSSGIIFYDRILPSGENQEIGQALMPVSDADFESQLRSIKWL